VAIPSKSAILYHITRIMGVFGWRPGIKLPGCEGSCSLPEVYLVGTLATSLAQATPGLRNRAPASGLHLPGVNCCNRTQGHALTTAICHTASLQQFKSF